MRILNNAILLHASLVFFACGQAKSETELVEVVKSSFIEEGVEPPPEDYRMAKFPSVGHWLTSMCATEKQGVVAGQFYVGMFESEAYYLYLVGKRDSVVGNDHYSKIAYEPEFMYYKLPEDRYAKLSRKEMREKITVELKQFISSDKFKSCFLSGAKSFITEYNGENLLIQ